jgi:hypothetical protein
MQLTTRQPAPDNFKYYEFVYKVPVIEPIPFYQFEGKSLEEIEKAYGRDVAQEIYNLWTVGIDLTKIKDPTLKTESFYIWQYTERTATPDHLIPWDLYLLPTKYTLAKEKLKIAYGQINHILALSMKEKKIMLQSQLNKINGI